MKSSLSSATAVLRGFAGWFSSRGGEALSGFDDEAIPNVVWACGREISPEAPEPDDRRQFAVRRERWSPGLSLDNFS
jgi:hypothetical protein